MTKKSTIEKVKWAIDKYNAITRKDNYYSNQYDAYYLVGILSSALDDVAKYLEEE